MRIIKTFPKKRSWELALRKDEFGAIQEVLLADGLYRDPKTGTNLVKEVINPNTYWRHTVYFTNREKAEEAGFEIVKPFIFEANLRLAGGWHKGSVFEDIETGFKMQMKHWEVHQILKNLIDGKLAVENHGIVGQFMWTK